MREWASLGKSAQGLQVFAFLVDDRTSLAWPSLMLPFVQADERAAASRLNNGHSGLNPARLRAGNQLFMPSENIIVVMKWRDDLAAF